MNDDAANNAATLPDKSPSYWKINRDWILMVGGCAGISACMGVFGGAKWLTASFVVSSALFEIVAATDGDKFKPLDLSVANALVELDRPKLWVALSKYGAALTAIFTLM